MLWGGRFRLPAARSTDATRVNSPPGRRILVHPGRPAASQTPGDKQKLASVKIGMPVGKPSAAEHSELADESAGLTYSAWAHRKSRVNIETPMNARAGSGSYPPPARHGIGLLRKSRNRSSRSSRTRASTAPPPTRAASDRRSIPPRAWPWRVPCA
jgi:hypothetical protein